MHAYAQARLALAFAGLFALTACAAGPGRLSAAAPRCVDSVTPIYFEPGSAELTDEGRTALATAASEAAGCTVERVSVIGLADAAGAPQDNLILSRQRAAAVTQALEAVKLPAAAFAVSAAGEAGALTPAGAAEPLRRRVDIVLDMKN